MMTLNEEIASFKREVEALREIRLSENTATQNSTIIQEYLLFIKGEIRKLNHKLMRDDLRRNSLLLSTADKTHVNGCSNTDNEISNIQLGIASPKSSCIVGSDSSHVDDVAMNSPDISHDRLMLDRLLHDEGGLPSAPSYSQVCGSQRQQRESSLRLVSANSDVNLIELEVMHSEPDATDAVDDETRTMDNRNRENGHATQPPPLAEQVKDDRHRTEMRLREKGKGVEATPTSSIAVMVRSDRNETLPNMNSVTSEKGTRSDDDGFILVRNKKHSKKNVVGSRVLKNSTLKSVIKTADLYVGNCDVDVTTDALNQYIHDNANISPIKCEKLVTKYDNYQSFKVTLLINERDKLLISDFWPNGIVCRKFYKPRNNK